MSCITEISALHEVPGRIRYFVPQIKSSPANAATLREYLKKIPGVYHAKSCAQLGTLIVYFDGAELTKDSLSEHIHACQLPEKTATAHHAPASLMIRRYPAVNRNHAGRSGTKHALLMDLVKHGLLVAGGGSGSLGFGITALRTLLTVASRAH